MIVPAIITDKQEELEEKVKKVKKHVSDIQLDVMDGKFVKQKSLDFDFKLPQFKGKYEAHLMVKDPSKFLDKNVDMFLIHYESVDREKLYDLMGKIKEKGKEVGLSINPETEVKEIQDLLSLVDRVQVMTVHPGKYGSRFLKSMVKKVEKLNEIREKTGFNFKIEVDGGQNLKNAKMCKKAGADIIAAGSFIFKNKKLSVKKAIKKLKKVK